MVERAHRRAILDGMLKPLDVIQLRVTVDAWDAGTVATVLEADTDRVLAEVADGDGRTLDVISVPVDAAIRIDSDNGGGHLRTSSDTTGRL